MEHNVIYPRNYVYKEPWRPKNYELFKEYADPKTSFIDYIKIFSIIFPNHPTLRNQSCVYGIFYNREKCLYIGTTGNLYRRLKQHISSDTYIGNMLRLAFRLDLKLEVELLYHTSSFKKELELIQKHSPEYNNKPKVII